MAGPPAAQPPSPALLLPAMARRPLATLPPLPVVTAIDSVPSPALRASGPSGQCHTSWSSSSSWPSTCLTSRWISHLDASDVVECYVVTRMAHLTNVASSASSGGRTGGGRGFAGCSTRAGQGGGTREGGIAPRPRRRARSSYESPRWHSGTVPGSRPCPTPPTSRRSTHPGLFDGRRTVMLLVWCKLINLQIAPLSFLGNVDRRWESSTAYTIDSIVMDLLGKQVDNFVHPGKVRIILPIMVVAVALTAKHCGVSLPIDQSWRSDQVRDPMSFGKPSPFNGALDWHAPTPLRPLR